MSSPLTYNPTPEIGNFFDWIKEAAPKVKNTAQDVLPVVKQYKDVLSNNNNTPVYYSPGTALPTSVYQNPNQQMYHQPADNNNNGNNKTAIYIALAAAAIVVIILLNKK